MTFDNFQKKIINLNNGRHLVLAPPGCGKTAILAARVAQAIDMGVNPDDMLCLTFTNRASRGMQSRIAEQDCPNGDKVFVGNTHRFCGRFLYENQIVEMSTGILDENDSLSIVLEMAKTAKQPGEMTFTERQRIAGAYSLQHMLHQMRRHHPERIWLNTDQKLTDSLQLLCNELRYDYSPATVVDIYDHPESVPENIANSPFHCGIVDKLRLAALYEKYKRDNSLIDFDDMLLLTYDSLRGDNSRRRYRWIQVDEVQDLSPLQLSIVSLLEAEPGVTLYLGDEQQSIFSFIGARRTTIDMLREKCGDNIHRLEKNYRSPFYLLDIYNRYAAANFSVDKNMLPSPHNDEKACDGDLKLFFSDNNEKCAVDSAKLARSFHDEGTTAIIVPTNRDADLVSNALADIPHFKISGADFFATDPMQFIMSHMSVTASEHNTIAWSKILTHLHLVSRPDIARRTIMKMQSAAINPSDFLLYENGSYLTRFINAYRSNTVVIFDTETTGLDVFNDDIVQIAAIKVSKGKIVDKLNIVMTTNREIPAMLGDIVNPLTELYSRSQRLQRRDGLQQFLDFARESVLIGHNVEFDYHILENNIKAEGFTQPIKQLLPERFDTLKLSRTVYPRLYSYKLKNLLTALRLEGENSHLADDDIIATKSLADHLYQKVSDTTFLGHHEATLSSARNFRQRFKECYGSFYSEAVDRLYVNNRPTAMVDEIASAQQFLLDRELLDSPMDKLRYVLKFLSARVPDSDDSLIEQLRSLLVDFSTYREADLCDNSIVDEKIFVTTVHKAKGLEFDNVIVFGPVDGTYPFFKSETNDQRLEDARKLYVALTRARRRLYLLPYNFYLATTSYGVKRYSKDVSPFLRPILNSFTTDKVV